MENLKNWISRYERLKKQIEMLEEELALTREATIGYSLTLSLPHTLGEVPVKADAVERLIVCHLATLRDEMKSMNIVYSIILDAVGEEETGDGN